MQTEFALPIRQEMLRLIDRYFVQTDLKEKAQQSVNYKKDEGFHFGELTIFHHEMFGGKSKHIISAAATVELLILSSDLFDDLQDQDNSSTPWSKWNPALTLNIATGLLYLSTIAMNLIGITNNLRQKFDQLVIQTLNGQHSDILNTIKTEEQYIDITSQISGSLVALACLTGTILATENHHDIVRKYAIHIGIVEQIKNDLNDIFSFDKSDWRLKKHTLPILFILEHNIQSIIFDYYNSIISFKDLCTEKENVKKILLDSGAITYANSILRKHQLLAIEQMKILPICNEYKARLSTIFKIN